MRRTVIALAILFVAACASGPPKAPDEGGAPWLELTSLHFVLRTDLDRSHAQAVVDFLEQMDDALEHVAFPTVSGSTRVLVVDFANESEFQAFMPLGLSGRMTPQLPNDIEQNAAVISFGQLGEPGSAERIAFTHELTHYLLHASAFGTVPVWFDEGTAEYFATATLDSDHVILGQPSVVAYTPQWAIPTVEQIVHATREDFYTGISSYDVVSDERAHQTTGFYAGSWWLMHMLRNGPEDLAQRFDSVIAACNRGESFAKEWDAIIVPNGYGDIEKRFRDYIQGRDLSLMRASYRAQGTDQSSVRSMSAEETRLLWARLVRWDSPEGWRSWNELDAQTKIDPHGAEISYFWGLYRLEKKNFAGAVPLFEHAVAAAPREPRYLFGLALAQSDARKDPKDRAANAAIGKTLAALESVADSPAQLSAVALFHAAKHDFARADEIAGRACEMDPSCVACAISRAAIAFDAGELDDAVRFQRRAIFLLPDGADPKPAEKTLARYEASLKAHPAPPPAAAPTPSSQATPSSQESDAGAATQ